MEWQEKYAQALASPHWKSLRRKMIERTGEKCERCKEHSIFLELHHVSYENLGKETPLDVQLLCRECHKLADKEREMKSAVRQEESLWVARLNGWASKKYGDDWWFQYNQEAIEDEFEEWLDSKGDQWEWSY